MSGRGRVPDGALFVGRLGRSARTRDLEDIFERYGRLLRCDVKYGTEMAYAFVDFEDRRDAEDALRNENGREIAGSSISIEWSKGYPAPRRERTMAPRDRGYAECYRCQRRGHWARDCTDDKSYGYRRPSRGSDRRSGYSPSRRRRTRSRSRSKSRDRRRRSRSRSRDRRRSRSTSKDRKRDRSGSRGKSGSRDRSGSKSPDRKKSRDKSPRKSKSRSKSRSRSKDLAPAENGEPELNNRDTQEQTKEKSRSRSRSRSKSH